MKIEAKLSRPLEVLTADEEIITLSGWDLGFITAGRPLHVLHVDPGAEIAAHGVCANDLLIGIDGRSVSVIAKDDVAKLLKVASRLDFERCEPDPPVDGKDVIMEPAIVVEPRVADAPEPAPEAKDVAMAPAAAPAPAPAAAPAPAPAAAPAPAPAAGPPAMTPPPTAPPSAVPPAMTPPPGAPPAGAPPPMAMAAPAAPTAFATAAEGESWVPQTVTGVPAPRGQPLEAGMKVRLKGFSSDAMNGLKGTLGRFSEKQGLWQVFLESNPTAKAVRPQNLELAEQDQKMQDAALAPGPNSAAPPAAGGPPGAGGGHEAGAPKDEPMPEGLPLDSDGDAWVELLRDAYMRQLRSDNEYPEPPPYERVNRLAANQFPVPEGMFPAHALRMQSQMLHRCFNGDGPRPGRRRMMPPPPRFVAGFVFPQARMM